MQIPLLRGRDFHRRGRTGAPATTIVSQQTAKKFWGEDDPIGRQIVAAPGRETFSP